MPIYQAIILGIVQGLSEFLPISSSGHLALVPWLFGWDALAGDPQLNRTFDVALHVGTFVGALAYFRSDIVRLLAAGVGSIRRRSIDEPDERIAWLLVLASLPAATIGFVLDSLVEGRFGGEWLIGVMLIVFGLLLYAADRLPERRPIGSYRPRDAILMGFAQALALQPGVSRSGATITMARWLGLERDAAVRISFLMSLPIIAGAGIYKGAQVLLDGGVPGSFVPAFAWGMAAAAATGWLAVWLTLRLVRTRTFAPFVVYRVGAGVAVILVAVTGFR